MLIDRVIWPVNALGPGNRIAIWTVGCSRHCSGCSNKELWAFDRSKDISIDSLYSMVMKCTQGKHVDGITFTGGDPFEQFNELLDFLERVKPNINDVLVYTGMNWSDVRKTFSLGDIERITRNISVLIDGPYIASLNDNRTVLRGSVNQNVIYFDKTVVSKYEEYLGGNRIIQNFISDTGIVSVGIHNREE